MEVVGLIARGHTTKEIAHLLGITERAVKAHVAVLMEKVGAPNRAGLIAKVLSSAGFGVDAAVRAPLDRIGAQVHVATDPEREFALYDNAPFMVQVMTGRELRFAFVNRRWLDVLHLSRDDFIGRTEQEVFPNVRAEYLEAKRRAFDEGRPVFFNNAPGRWRDHNGNELERNFNFVFQPLRDRTDSVVGLLILGDPVDAP